MLEKVLLRQDVVDIQNSLVVSLKREHANSWKHLGNLSKVTSLLMALELNN
jgi:hypothetical protein